MARSRCGDRETPSGPTPTARLLRVDPATLAIFSVMFSPAAFVAVLAWRHHQLRDAALMGALYVLALYWMCGRTVELAPGKLVYRVFFTKREIDLSAVRAARVVAHPAPTLELRRQGSREWRPAFILKPFKKAGVGAMLRHVRACSPDAVLDPVAQDMAEGRFDSISRETIRAMHLRPLALILGLALAAAAAVRLVLVLRR